MKHAGSAALAGIAALMAELRERDGMVERKPGIFYRKGQAFLHFHEDEAGVFADLKDGPRWRRIKLDEMTVPAFLGEVDGLLIARIRLEPDDFR